MIWTQRNPLARLGLTGLVACLLSACQEAQVLSPQPGSLASRIQSARLKLRVQHPRPSMSAGAGSLAYLPAALTARAYLATVLGKNLSITCGHRGACGYAPENTLPSFALALTEKCQMFECDVRLSKDNQLILVHDDDLARTTNGHGSCHAHAYSGDLDKLDAGSWFSPTFAGTKLPTLRETLMWCKDKPILPLLHLKETGLAGPVSALLTELDMQEHVSVHTEVLGEIDAFKLLSPKTMTLPLWFEPPDAQTQMTYLRAHHHDGVALPFEAADTKLIQTLQSNGFLVELFTLDANTDDILGTVGKNANILTADYPDLILEALGATT